ncbi:MAG TPA: universal stress protein [Gemmatimonadales bacterium]|nr:universal stress protein [Gemmatimonadales bacterium]
MRWRRILIGVDFRTPSLHAARWAAAALGARAELELAYVASPTLAAFDDSPAPTLRTARAGLQAFAETLRAGGGAAGAGNGAPLRVRVHVEAGATVSRLCALARRRGADLVVVGRGPVSTRRGRTLERLLRHQRVPVLVVGAGAPVPAGPVRRVLAALDTAPIGAQVAGAAGAFAALAGDAATEFTLLHVGREGPGRPERWTSEVEGWLRAQGEPLAAELRGAGVTDVARLRVQAVAGVVAPVVLAAAREQGSELVVIGRNGRHAAGATEFGSAARVVVRAAPMPVLVVPPAGERPPRGGPRPDQRERRGLRLIPPTPTPTPPSPRSPIATPTPAPGPCPEPAA